MPSITAIPALDSNYFWVIRPNPDQPAAYIVDPGDAEPVIAYFSHNRLNLAGILITHRHRDHTHGIAGLLNLWQVPVYGPDSESIPQVTDSLTDGDLLRLDGLEFRVMGVPGHTWEHIAFFLNGADGNPPMVFCGDALFAGGCGRRFDGTAEIMWNSLQKLANLPEATLVYCAHEYTLANLEFAMAFDTNNPALRERIARVRELRHQGITTLPSTILLEKRTNPFLRCQQPGIKNIIEGKLGTALETPAELFGGLRLLKDQWPS